MPVQKDKGWEFTDLSSDSTPSACEPPATATSTRAGARAGGRRDGAGVLQVDGAAERGGELPEGVIVSTLGEAVAEHPELVEPHLGSLVARPRQVLRAEHGDLARRRVRLRARRRAGRGAGRRSRRSRRRAGTAHALALADRGRGRAPRLTVAEQYLSGARRPRGLLQPGHRDGRRRGRERSSTCACRTSRSAAGSSAASARRSDATRRCTGSASASARARASCGWRPTSRAAAPRARVTGAYVGHGTPAHRLRHDAGARRSRHDLGPRLPRHPARPRDRGLERHDQVDPGAQRTDAFQESRNLLLSDGAHADAIPGLEIEANDVRCTHAATVARLDEEQIFYAATVSKMDAGQVFYLMSRGLPRAEAERLLVGGFLEVIAGAARATPRPCARRCRPRSSASSKRALDSRRWRSTTTPGRSGWTGTAMPSTRSRRGPTRSSRPRGRTASSTSSSSTAPVTSTARGMPGYDGAVAGRGRIKEMLRQRFFRGRWAALGAAARRGQAPRRGVAPADRAEGEPEARQARRWPLIPPPAY